MKKMSLLERLRTMWHTLRDHPGSQVELRFGVLPPCLLVGLEAAASDLGVTLGEATYLALVEGVQLFNARRRLHDLSGAGHTAHVGIFAEDGHYVTWQPFAD